MASVFYFVSQMSVKAKLKLVIVLPSWPGVYWVKTRLSHFYSVTFLMKIQKAGH